MELYVTFYTWHTFSGIVHVSWSIQEVILKEFIKLKKIHHTHDRNWVDRRIDLTTDLLKHEFNISAFSKRACNRPRKSSLHAWRGRWICVRSKDAQKQLARTSLSSQQDWKARNMKLKKNGWTVRFSLELDYIKCPKKSTQTAYRVLFLGLFTVCGVLTGIQIFFVIKRASRRGCFSLFFTNFLFLNGKLWKLQRFSRSLSDRFE